MHALLKQPNIGIKNFAGKIIDYAGIFPPASLNLAQALNNYLFYRLGEYKWMLNKFIVRAAGLSDLSRLLQDVKIDSPIPISLIGTGGDTISQFRKNFLEDIRKTLEFLELNSEFACIDVFEVKMPMEIMEQEGADDMLDLMISVSGDMDSSLGRELPVYYESMLGDKFEENILKVVENIASLNNKCGYKLRTGGSEALSFPSSEQIAFAIMTCAEFNVPMKFTAGLHHPIRHFNDKINTYMHGFFNVFGAGILAYTNGLDEADLIEVLDDDDPEEFMFDEHGFEWNEIEVTNEEIREARSRLVVSYGSCSFDEPVEDLKVMELL